MPDLLHQFESRCSSDRSVTSVTPAQARHQHEPGKTGVVQEQDGAEGEVADRDRVGSSRESSWNSDVHCDHVS